MTFNFLFKQGVFAFKVLAALPRSGTEWQCKHRCIMSEKQSGASGTTAARRADTESLNQPNVSPGRGPTLNHSRSASADCSERSASGVITSRRKRAADKATPSPIHLKLDGTEAGKWLKT